MKSALRILGFGSSLVIAMAAPSFAQSGTTPGYNPSSGAAVSNSGAVNTSNNRNATNYLSPSPSQGGGAGGSSGGGGAASGSGGGSSGGGAAGGSGGGTGH
jgi:hypothetical protein